MILDTVDTTMNSTGTNKKISFSSLLSMASAGTVTSVSWTGDGTIFTASADTAVTTSGTLTPASLISQTKNTFLGGPTTGSNAAPTFRALGATDIPNLPASQITSGQLAIAQGGTAAATATAAFNALSPMTTAGDVIIGGTSGAGTRLGIGSAGQVLTTVSGTPAWTAPLTATNGSAALASSYSSVTTSFTNVGLSITLPAAGTYLLIANVRSQFNLYGSAGNSSFMSAQLYDSTNSNVVANTLTLLSYIALQTTVSSGNATYAIGCFPVGPAMYTVSGAATINVQARYTNSAGTMGSQTIPSDSNGLTTLSYFRLS